MSQQSSFADMFLLFSANREVLKDWTFIVATTEADNMDLYAGLEGIPGIKDRMFTPFVRGRVSIINDKIWKRCLKENDSRARTYRCVSFDTQTVSYIERFYKNKEVQSEGFDAVLHMLKSGEIGIDHIPYTLENLTFDISRKDSVEQTLFAYEMLCGENAGKEKLCRKLSRSIVSLYENKNFEAPFHTKELYKIIYLTLLKMSIIQLQYPKLSVEKKLRIFVDFVANKLCKITQPEINLARVYFLQGSTCGFFGKIHAKNKAVLEQLKNMTWDLLHLRFMDYSCMMFDAKKGDALIPYFFTYDKRLISVRDCYSLQALAINTCKYFAIPIYAMNEGLKDVLREHCTIEKHRERMIKNPDIECLIAETERELLKLIQ